MSKRKVLVAELLVLILTPLGVALYPAGCATAKYQVHPGAANSFDSQCYDALLVAHSVIEATKTDLGNGVFPPAVAKGVTTAVNNLVIAYNVTDTAYQAYHTAALAGSATPAQQNAVQNGLTQMSTATTSLTNAKAGK